MQLYFFNGIYIYYKSQMNIFNLGDLKVVSKSKNKKYRFRNFVKDLFIYVIN